MAPAKNDTAKSEDAEMKDASVSEAKAEQEAAPEVEAKDKEEAKQPVEEPKEKEVDAAADTRKKLANTINFNTQDTTLNVMPTANGKCLMSLCEGGFQYLVSAARANTGVKAGRYMFEIAVVEGRAAAPPAQQSGRPAMASSQLVRVGFATGDASLFLSEGNDSMFFDSDGNVCQGKSKKKTGARFAQNHTVAVLLNLESGSPNFNTISLFKNGARVTEPQPLPENLTGKTLYPTVNFKNVTLRINFGLVPIHALPFQCRMLQDAADADCEIVKHSAPANGTYEVLFPVGLPDEGTFDWVDSFLASNKHHVELSTRMIVDWAIKSGLWQKQTLKSCTDKPELSFGIPQLDDMSVSKILASVAPLMPRNFLVAEVNNNLLAAARETSVGVFTGFNFKKVAIVVVGEPPQSFKEKVQQNILADKKKKAEQEQKRKKAEALRKKAMDSKMGKKTDADEDVAMEEDEEVTVELTEDEKKLWFHKKATPDLTERQLAKSFASFSLPQKAEGFDEIRFEWQPDGKCQEYLKDWILKRKQTTKIEDIQPIPWFTEKNAEWQKAVAEWQKKQTEWKQVIEQLSEWKKEGKEDDSKPTEVNAEELDVFAVENVSDIGSGEPLFANFEYEDWCLLSLRSELHLLLHAFRRGVDDADRPSFPETHLQFYYQRYCKKILDIKHFGVPSLSSLIELVRDTATVDGPLSILKTSLPEDESFDKFVKLAEEHRRDRQRRLDAGDETAALKFSKPAPKQVQRKGPQAWQPAQRAPQQAPKAGQTIQPVQQAQVQRPAVIPRYTPYQPAATGQQRRPYTPAPKAVGPPAKQARTTYGGRNW